MDTDIQDGKYLGWFGDRPFRSSKVISDVLGLKSNGLSANGACHFRPLSIGWLALRSNFWKFFPSKFHVSYPVRPTMFSLDNKNPGEPTACVSVILWVKRLDLSLRLPLLLKTYCQKDFIIC